MTMPTIDDLFRIFDDAGLKATDLREFDFYAGVAAVRDAVIEALVRDAVIEALARDAVIEALAQEFESPDYMDTNTADRIRSFKEATDDDR